VTANEEIAQKMEQPGKSGNYRIMIESRSAMTEIRIAGQ
jgi:hypothetical protein